MHACCLCSDCFNPGYPALHSSDWVKWQIVANYSLLYHIKGSNPSLRPYLLMSHLDVVPADANEWTYPPFGAEIHDGFINARGALDQKEGVFVRFCNIQIKWKIHRFGWMCFCEMCLARILLMSLLYKGAWLSSACHVAEVEFQHLSFYLCCPSLSIRSTCHLH